MPFRSKATARAVNRLGVFHAQQPAGQVDLMDAVVDDIAARIAPEMVPVVEIVVVELRFRCRAVPHVPVKPGGGSLSGTAAVGKFAHSLSD